MHTLLDLHGNIPTFIRITDGRVHHVTILDEILPEAGAFYVMDRGYIESRKTLAYRCAKSQRRHAGPPGSATLVNFAQLFSLIRFQSCSSVATRVLGWR